MFKTVWILVYKYMDFYEFIFICIVYISSGTRMPYTFICLLMIFVTMPIKAQPSVDVDKL